MTIRARSLIDAILEDLAARQVTYQGPVGLGAEPGGNVHYRPFFSGEPGSVYTYRADDDDPEGDTFEQFLDDRTSVLTGPLLPRELAARNVTPQTPQE